MIILLLLLFNLNSFSANTKPVDHWETAIYYNDTWNYQPGYSEPGAGWNTLSFNDSSWMEGPGGIGYGDGDDNTTIGQNVSLFLRIKFNIIDTSKIESAILHVDYDDAFVAYKWYEVPVLVFPHCPAYNQHRRYRP
jgi:hypothetical protein